MKPVLRIWIVVLGVSLGVAGCANSRPTHEPGLVARWERQPFPPSEPPPALSLVLHTRYVTFEEPSDSPVAAWWAARKIRRRLEAVRGEFPFLSHAQWDAPDTPARLVIEATSAIRGRKVLSRLNRMTYSAIPASERGVVELEAWLYLDRSLRKTYEAVGSYQIKRHLLLLLAPMWWGPTVAGRTMEDTFRDLFLQIQRDAPSLLLTEGHAEP